MRFDLGQFRGKRGQFAPRNDQIVVADEAGGVLDREPHRLEIGLVFGHGTEHNDPQPALRFGPRRQNLAIGREYLFYPDNQPTRRFFVNGAFQGEPGAVILAVTRAALLNDAQLDGFLAAGFDSGTVAELAVIPAQGTAPGRIESHDRVNLGAIERPDHHVHGSSVAALQLCQMDPDIVLRLDQPGVFPAVDHFNLIGGLEFRGWRPRRLDGQKCPSCQKKSRYGGKAVHRGTQCQQPRPESCPQRFTDLIVPLVER